MPPSKPRSAAKVTLRNISARAGDGVQLRGVQLATHPRRDLAIVVSHGFTHGVRRKFTRRMLSELAVHADVVALNFRGHGDSDGRCTVGIAEVLDVDAALGWARAQGYPAVASLGFSMGASVVIRQAGLQPEHRADAVVAVSGPARWWSRETAAMRRVHWLLEQPHGRAFSRLIGVRLGEPWDGVPPSPVEAVAGIAPTPLLLVHGDADRYFATAHAHALHAGSGGHAELWIELGMGHGESGTSRELIGRLAGWIQQACSPRSSREGAAA